MASSQERSNGTAQAWDDAPASREVPSSAPDAAPPPEEPTAHIPADEVRDPGERPADPPPTGEAPADPTAPRTDADPFTPPDARRVGVMRKPLVAWLVAGVLLGALIALAVVAVPLLRAEAQRDAVRDRAEVIAARVTTFEGATIDEWVAETQRLATGDYAEQLTEVFDQDLRRALRENEVESVGEIQRSFVQRIEGDVAEVFVLARQTSINALRDQPSEDELRIEVTLRREDGEWLASNIVVLGPQQAAPQSPPVPEPEGEIAPEPTAPPAETEADGEAEPAAEGEADAEQPEEEQAEPAEEGATDG